MQRPVRAEFYQVTGDLQHDDELSAKIITVADVEKLQVLCNCFNISRYSDMS